MVASKVEPGSIHHSIFKYFPIPLFSFLIRFFLLIVVRRFLKNLYQILSLARLNLGNELLSYSGCSPMSLIQPLWSPVSCLLLSMPLPSLCSLGFPAHLSSISSSHMWQKTSHLLLTLPRVLVSSLYLVMSNHHRGLSWNVNSSEKLSINPPNKISSSCCHLSSNP